MRIKTLARQLITILAIEQVNCCNAKMEDIGFIPQQDCRILKDAKSNNAHAFLGFGGR